ncbi:TPA: hypothetical protein HA244_04840 [Candidatus Micrarchaeota archaeon]|nr:hypothetical protein [Candidatus Micrarchaeota archaeon]
MAREFTEKVVCDNGQTAGVLKVKTVIQPVAMNCLNKSRKRGQHAVEFIMVLGIFSLVLVLLNNHLNEFRKQDSLLPVQKNLLSQLSLLSGEAFAHEESVSLYMPCFQIDGGATPYWVYGGSLDADGNPTQGTSEITMLTVAYGSKQSVETVFPLYASPNPLVFTCANGQAGRITMSKTPLGPGYPQPGVLLTKT